MTTTTDRSEATGLQFDHAEQADGSRASGEQTLECSNCRRPIETEYYQVGDAVACDECRAAVVRELEAAAAQGRRASGFARAVLLGLGAAIAGAIIYYAVIAVTEWELAIVALLIGYMVGWSVRRGSRGVGGRRYQWTAILLTYLSVGMAYTPMAYKGLVEAQQKISADSAKAIATAGSGTVPGGGNTAAPASAGPSGAAAGATAPTPASAAPAAAGTATTPAGATGAPANGPARAAGQRDGTGAPRGPVPWAALGIALVAALLASLVLPLVVVFGMLPGGILNGVIIGVGMQQAWKMTRAARIPVSGPYRVGTVGA